MASFKRLEQKLTHRLSDQDSGYEDLSPTSRSDDSFEDIERKYVSKWQTPNLMECHDKKNGKGVYITNSRETPDKYSSTNENRKIEVKAGKIGISHLIRQWNSKIREQELPNLKTAIKSSKVLSEDIETRVTFRKPRGKRRSKSADGRPVRQISMFNPIYTNILSPREMEKHRKWTQKLRLDAILDEEYYKLPYEEINKEIALGRYSRSEPRLNWKRKQKKKVCFSADIEQRGQKESGYKLFDGNSGNWKEDSGFHELDTSPLKPIVKESCKHASSFDDSNIFSEDDTLSDSSSNDSVSKRCPNESNNPLESELQSLLHLIKEQEKILSTDDLPNESLNTEKESKYIRELVYNHKSPLRIPKVKPRKFIFTNFKSMVKIDENFKTSTTDNISTNLVNENEMETQSICGKPIDSECTLIQNFMQSQPSLNINSKKSSNFYDIESEDNNTAHTNGNIEIINKSPNPFGEQKVTAVKHTEVNLIEPKPTTNDKATCTHTENEKIATTFDQSSVITEEKELISNTFESKDVNKKSNPNNDEIIPEKKIESKEEARKRFFEIISQPVKTISDVQWHRDFIISEEKSSLKHSDEDQPNKITPLLSVIGGRIKSPSRQNNINVATPMKIISRPPDFITADVPNKKPTNFPMSLKTINGQEIIKVTLSQLKTLKSEKEDNNNRIDSQSQMTPKNTSTENKIFSSSSQSINSIISLNDTNRVPSSPPRSPKSFTIDNNIIQSGYPPQLSKVINADTSILAIPPASHNTVNIDKFITSTPSPTIVTKAIEVDTVIKATVSLPKSDIDNNTQEDFKIYSCPPRSPKHRNNNVFISNPISLLKLDIIDTIKQTTDPVLGTEDFKNNKLISTIIKDGPVVSQTTSHSNQLLDIFGKDEQNILNSSEQKKKESFESNNSRDENILPLSERSTFSQINCLSNHVDNCRQNYIKSYGSIKKSLIDYNQEYSDTNHNPEEIGTIKCNNNEKYFNPDRGEIMNNKLTTEEEFICETDNSDAAISTDISDSTEAESDYDSTESSGESGASYTLEHTNHEISIKDSPNHLKCSVNEHHEYFKEEGQSTTSTDREKAIMNSIVRKKVEETITDIINVTSVINRDRISSRKSEKNNAQLIKPTSNNDCDEMFQSKNATNKADILPFTESTISPVNINFEYEDTTPSPKTPPLALPRKSLLNREPNRLEQNLSKQSKHMEKEDKQNPPNVSRQYIKQNREKRIDNMTKIKQAFIKAGLNPNVFDDLDNFSKQNYLLRSDFRENFVNMFMTKEFDITDYNIHLRTKTNSRTPNLTVTRKYLPLSTINDQMSWMRQTPTEKPVYICQIASSNENINKAALSLSKATNSGSNSPEECYEYNDRDESPIDNETTSPTPSWTESSSSGCFSASCSPTPHPMVGKSLPIPTSL